VQTALARKAEIVLEDECLSLSLAEIRGIPLVLGVTRGGLSVWSLAPPTAPQLRFLLSRPGLRGALFDAGRYVVWGREGVFAVRAPDPRWSNAVVQGPREDVLRVITAGTGFVALARDKLMRLDAELRCTAEIPMPGGFDLAAAGRFAIVANETGLSAVDITTPTPRMTRSGRRKVAGIGPARVSGHAAAFYCHNIDGTHAVVEFAAKGPLTTLATYAEEPWFAASCIVGPVLVRRSPLRRIITVYETRKVKVIQT